MRRKIVIENNREIQVLRIPYFSQSDSDWLCFAYSMKMCLEYFKNIYKNEYIKKVTPNLSVEDIKQITHTSEFTGTRIDDDLMRELSKKIPSINFMLIENCTVDFLRKKFARDLPTIVLYNCSYMLREEAGPGHAGVVIGIIENNNIILNNPWLGPERLISWREFQKGWELEYNRAVIMEPDPYTQERLEVEE